MSDSEEEAEVIVNAPINPMINNLQAQLEQVAFIMATSDGSSTSNPTPLIFKGHFDQFCSSQRTVNISQ